MANTGEIRQGSRGGLHDDIVTRVARGTTRCPFHSIAFGAFRSRYPPPRATRLTTRRRPDHVAEEAIASTDLLFAGRPFRRRLGRTAVEGRNGNRNIRAIARNAVQSTRSGSWPHKGVMMKLMNVRSAIGTLACAILLILLAAACGSAPETQPSASVEPSQSTHALAFGVCQP